MPNLPNGTLAWGESVVNGENFEVVENLFRLSPGVYVPHPRLYTDGVRYQSDFGKDQTALIRVWQIVETNKGHDDQSAQMVATASVRS